ncbi:hypothetical protein M758_3G020900 [Ceratodon purpureus]|nr:hypothetical protein M758_3G020900 [Ceratodon purpureus]
MHHIYRRSDRHELHCFFFHIAIAIAIAILSSRGRQTQLDHRHLDRQLRHISSAQGPRRSLSSISCCQIGRQEWRSKMAEKGDRFMAHLEAELPLGMEALVLPFEDKRVGLVIVDEVNGFCTVGNGNLAPTESVEAVTEMVKHTDHLAKQFSARTWPIIAFLDTHQEHKPEPPYPPHCIEGTGEENLVPELLWLESDPNTTLMRKDCINGFVGGIRDDGSNIVIDWIKNNKIQQILVVGICTDICVMDFVVTALSARNHGIMKPLEDVFVFSEACATYHLPLDVAKTLKPPAFPHPQDITHYMGLYFAKSRGARIVNKVSLL